MKKKIDNTKTSEIPNIGEELFFVALLFGSFFESAGRCFLW